MFSQEKGLANFDPASFPTKLSTNHYKTIAQEGYYFTSNAKENERNASINLFPVISYQLFVVQL